MKKVLIVFILFSQSFMVSAHASDDLKNALNKTDTFFKHSEVFKDDYSNILHFGLSTFKPNSLVIENARYKYFFSSETLNTFLLNGNWDKKLFSFLGQWGLASDLGYTRIKTRSRGPKSAPAQDLSYTLHIMPAGLAFSYSLQLWQRQWIIPVIQGGGRYYFYIQSGDTDGSYADGKAFHPFWSVGIRLALNHMFNSLFDMESHFPYFLEARYHQVLESKTAVSFAQDAYALGFSIGI